MKINVVIEFDRSIYAKLDAWDKELVEDIAARIAALTKQLEALVRANAPMGHGNHGGKLKSSIHSYVRRSERNIVGIVTSAVPYLPVVEFGLHKSLAVGAHERRLDHAWSRDIDPIEVSVDPYVRQANIEETLFMRRALETLSSEVVSELQAAIDAHSGEIK
jgi:hypothetical protein